MYYSFESTIHVIKDILSVVTCLCSIYVDIVLRDVILHLFVCLFIHMYVCIEKLLSIVLMYGLPPTERPGLWLR